MKHLIYLLFLLTLINCSKFGTAPKPETIINGIEKGLLDNGYSILRPIKLILTKNQIAIIRFDRGFEIKEPTSLTRFKAAIDYILTDTTLTPVEKIETNMFFLSRDSLRIRKEKALFVQERQAYTTYKFDGNIYSEFEGVSYRTEYWSLNIPN